MCDGISHQVSSAFQVEFGPDIGMMPMGRTNTDTQAVADLTVRIPFRDQLQYLTLTVCEGFRFGLVIAPADGDNR